MAFDITVDVSEMLAFAAELTSAQPLVNAEILDAMDASLNIWKQLAVAETPVGVTGDARRSINNVIHGQPPIFRGETVMGVLYGLPLERGRKPGKWPPRDAIALWVRRKLGVPEKEVDSVAFLIQRAIGQRGTKGAAMFFKASERGARPIMRIWEEVPGRVLAQLI